MDYTGQKDKDDAGFYLLFLIIDYQTNYKIFAYHAVA